jgi:FemAB-related protein (PEP-CTERM system-associated)
MATSEVPSVLVHDESRPRGPLLVRPLSLEQGVLAKWDEFVLTHAQGTPFHQTAWMRVMEKTYGYRPHYFHAERDGQITGVAPSFLVSNWISGRCLMSVPFAVYGGVCAADPETERALVERLEQVADEQCVEYLEFRDRAGELRAGYHANTRYASFTLPLIPETDKLYASLPKDVRYMIRKAEKAGLKVRRGFDQLDSFYELMTVNLRRLGTPAFPKALFENLVREFNSQIDLTLVYQGGKPVAGGMSFFFRDWMQPYYIGSLEEAKTMAANDFLWWKLMQQAAERGCATFDFGRSKKLSGNFEFKKKWNPRIESLNYQVRLFRRADVPNFSPANPKFEMAANLWKKMPLGLTRVFGPRVVRWFP